MRVRLVAKDKDGRVEEICEQVIHLAAPNVSLLLRRAHIGRMIATALCTGGSVTIECAALQS